MKKLKSKDVKEKVWGFIYSWAAEPSNFFEGLSDADRKFFDDEANEKIALKEFERIKEYIWRRYKKYINVERIKKEVPRKMIDDFIRTRKAAR